MNIIIDLLLIGILVLCVWKGYKKGLIMGISGILALVIAFYGANLIAETYSSEFTSMVKPFISGLVDGAVDEAKDDYELSNNSGGEQDKVYDISYESLKNMGILKSAAEGIANELKDDVQEVGSSLKAAMVHKLSTTIAYVATLVIVFFLIIIIFTVIANILNLAFKLPGLELLNGIGGAAFGLLKGLILIFAISWALRFLGFILPEEVVDKTIVLKWLMNNNPIISIFGH